MKYVSHDYQSCAAQLILDHPVAAIMPQVDGWVKSRERHRIPLYGQQRIFVRAAGFQTIRTNAYCDKGETSIPERLD